VFSASFAANCCKLPLILQNTNMKRVELNSVLRRAWRTAHELPEENRLALFDEVKSELVILNEVGGAVWAKLDGKKTVGEIAAELLAEATGAPSEVAAQAQVVAFIEDMLERQAVAEEPSA
jgi:hypothetical protein